MIKIKAEIYDEMVDHARSGVPYEIGGYLVGANGVISKIYKITNESKTPEVFFERNLKESFKAQKDSRAEGLQFLGFYHSHPKGGNKPSDTDKIYMSDPDLAYIIVSLQNSEPEVNAFWIKNKEAGPLELKIID